jgi:hypothetical protein
MYNVTLNKTLFQAGQEFNKAFCGTPDATKLPVGITQHLQGLTAQAKACWHAYAKLSDGHRDQEPLFGTAVRAVTLATLGAEILTQHFWVLRMPYYGGQYKLITEVEECFQGAATDLLSVMFHMAGELCRNPTPDTEAQCAVSIKKLQYALHLAEVGLAVCTPKQYGEESWLPNTSYWLGLCASTRRNLSSQNINAARLLEAQQRRHSKRESNLITLGEI